jgi:hypothetical protein
VESNQGFGLRPPVDGRRKSVLTHLLLLIIGCPSPYLWSGLEISRALPSRGVFSAILTFRTGRLEQVHVSLTSWFCRHGPNIALRVLVTIRAGHLGVLHPKNPESSEWRDPEMFAIR